MLFVVSGAGYYLLSLAAIMIKTHRARVHRRGMVHAAPGFTPPISILKPVKGIDGNLYDNLLTFVTQDYPEYEIIFGVQDDDDPALPILHRIKKEHPQRSMRIICSTERIGYNPKINNLAGIIHHAQYDHIVINDSNVRVTHDYLAMNIHYFEDPEIGLVSNIIRGTDANTPGAVLENLHLNSFVLGNVCCFDVFFNTSITVGKSVFFRKSQFDDLGGLQQFGNYLAEDYLIGKIYEDNGYRIIVSPHHVDNVSSAWSLKRFLNRHTRWAKLRWNICRTGYLFEIIANFSFWAVLGALLYSFNGYFGLTMMCALGLKITGDLVSNTFFLHSPLHPLLCIFSPVKDIIIAMLWLVPLINSKTKWRGMKLKVTKNSLLVPSN